MMSQEITEKRLANSELSYQISQAKEENQMIRAKWALAEQRAKAVETQNLDSADKLSQELRLKLQAAEEELDQMRTSATIAQQELIGLKHRNKLLETQSEDCMRLRNENADLRSKSDSISQQLLSMISSTDTAKITAEKFKVENSLLKQTVETLKAKAQSLGQETTDKEKEIGNLRSQLSELNRLKHLLTEQSEGLLRQLEASKATASTLEEEAKQSRLESKSLRTTLETTSGQLSSIQVSLAAAESEKARLKTDLAQAQANLDSFKKEQNKVLEGTKQLDAYVEEVSSLKSQVEQFRGLTDKAKAQIELLEKQKAETTAELDQIRAKSETQRHDLDVLNNKLKQLEALEPSLAALKTELQRTQEAESLLKQRVFDLEGSYTNQKQEAEILSTENLVLKGELQRLQDVMDKLVTKPATEAKYTASNFRSLEEQLKLAEAEATRLREEKQRLILDSEKVKQAELASVQLRDEISVSKTKIQFLEAEIKEKTSMLERKDRDHETLLSSIRLEMRQLQEKEAKSQLALEAATQKASRLSDEKLLKEKLQLELALKQCKTDLLDREEKLLRAQSTISTQKAAEEELQRRLLQKESVLANAQESLRVYNERSISHQVESETHLRAQLTEKDLEIQDLMDKIRSLEERERQLQELGFIKEKVDQEGQVHKVVPGAEQIEYDLV